MRKIKYLLVALAMSTTLLFGCGSNDDAATDGTTTEVTTTESTTTESETTGSTTESETTGSTSGELKDLTATELLDNLSKSEITEAKYFEFQFNAAIDYEATAEGFTSGMQLDAKITGKLDVENKILQLNATINASEMGETTIECYIAANTDEPALYLNMGGAWIKQSISTDDIAGLLGSFDIESEETTEEENLLNIEEALNYLKDSKLETVDGAYVLSGTINMDKIIEEINAEAGDSDEGAAVSGIISVLKDVVMKLKVAVNADYTLKGLEFSVDKFSTEMEGATISINEFSISFSLDKFENTKTITIPDEALNAIESDLGSLL